jgi:hypothetical protein
VHARAPALAGPGLAAWLAGRGIIRARRGKEKEVGDLPSRVGVRAPAAGKRGDRESAKSR